MDWFDRIRADLRTPDRRIDRSELPFLAGGAAFIVVAAQWQDPGSAVAVALVFLAGLAVAAWPLISTVPAEFMVSAITVPVGAAVGLWGTVELSFFLIVIATLYASWHLGSTIRAITIATLCSLVIIGATAWSDDGIAWTPWVAAEAFTFAAGRTLYRQQSLIDELDKARRALADQAVLQERQRIARELHDLSGHTLAAIMLHLTGARHVLHRDPSEAERALLDAETIGRTGMDRIRATVSALRSSEQGTDPALPDSGDLDDVIDEYRRAGLTIEACHSAPLDAVTGPTAIALHRIARESLANVARHAADNQVTLITELDPVAGAVRLEVRDRGRPPGRQATTGRFGLIGMQERARAVGGTLESGPTRDGWVVEAELPLAAVESPNHQR